MDLGGREMNKHNIPTEEDFARAKAAMRKNDQGLSAVRERILERFRHSGVHEFFVFYSPANNVFVAHVFYRRDCQIAEAEQSGLAPKIRDAVYNELETAGRGNHSAIKVTFEFDSDENVATNFDGDYFLRLR